MRYAFKTLVGARRASGSTRRWALLRRPAAWRSHRNADSRRRARRAARARWRSASPTSLATPDYDARPRRDRLRRPRALDRAGRRVLDARLRPPDGVPPARLPVSSSPPSTTSSGRPRARAERVARRADRQGLRRDGDRRADRADRVRSCGAGARRSSRWRWRAVYIPLILVGRSVMSEPLFDVFMLASLAAALAHRRSPHRYRWALLAGRAGAGWRSSTRAQRADPARCRWRSPCGTAAVARGAALGPPLVLVLAALLTVAPWTIRNARDAARLRARLDPVRLRAGGHLQRRGARRTR